MTYPHTIKASQGEYLGATLNEMSINEDIMSVLAKTSYSQYIDFFENVNRDHPFLEIRLRVFFESHHGYSNTTAYTVLACFANKMTGLKIPVRRAMGWTASEPDDGCFTGIFSAYDMLPSLAQRVTSECERLLLQEKHQDLVASTQNDAL